MLKKDRYSHAFIFLILGLIGAAYLFRNEKTNASILSILIGLIPMFYLMKKGSARIHLTDAQKANLDIEYKDEDDCGFTRHEKKNIDGIRVNGVRYKFVDGTDGYIDRNNVARPCGFGSALMQKIGAGGKEPKSIQHNDCWK